MWDYAALARGRSQVLLLPPHHMGNTLNQVTLQGTVGAPKMTFHPDGLGPLFASADLELDRSPSTSITVAGLGSEAGVIGTMKRGEILRVEGALTLDRQSGEFYVFCHTAARFTDQGGSLSAKPPTLAELSSLGAQLVDAAT